LAVAILDSPVPHIFIKSLKLSEHTYVIVSCHIEFIQNVKGQPNNVNGTELKH